MSKLELHDVQGGIIEAALEGTEIRIDICDPQNYQAGVVIDLKTAVQLRNWLKEALQETVE